MEKSNVDVLQLDATQSEDQLFNFVYITREIPSDNMGIEDAEEESRMNLYHCILSKALY